MAFEVPVIKNVAKPNKFWEPKAAQIGWCDFCHLNIYAYEPVTSKSPWFHLTTERTICD